MNISLDFTSYSFIIACAVFVALYYTVPRGFQWVLLLFASISIYLVTSPAATVFLLVTISVTYLSGLLIGKSKGKASRAAAMLIPLLIDTGLLVYAKYTGFLYDIFCQITSKISEGKAFYVIVPMGISFYTFQSLAYILDVYKGKTEAEKHPLKFMLFLSYFPQMIQGPISRYDDLKPQLCTPHKFDSKNLTLGGQRILYGFFKKLVIADRINIIISSLTEDTATYNGGWFLVVLLFYTIELYCDFSGGIDITIGISEMLGINIKENFLRPIFSESVARFWNRWHVTMGTWFRDYIYIPLGGSRVKMGRLIFNFFVVWLTTGIWHGAGWNYILWGLLNFLVIASSKLLDKPYGALRKALKCEGKKIYKGFCCIRTWFFASLFFTMFAYGSLDNVISACKTLFNKGSMIIFTDGSLLQIGFTIRDYIIVAAGLIIVFIVECIEERDAEGKAVAAEHSVRTRIGKLPYVIRVLIWLTLFTVIILAGAYGRGYNAAAFIYNRF